MKFLQYITEGEGRTKRIEKSMAVDFIKKNCKKNYNILFKNNESLKIYRGVNVVVGFGYINTNKGEPRISANTLNYSTLLMDNLPSWNGWPKRSRSIICSTNYDDSDSYGKVYYNIPYDNAKIGICSDHDVWRSFSYIRNGINSFNNLLENLMKIYDIKRSEKDWNIFVKALQELQNKFDYNTLPDDEKYYIEKHKSVLDMLFNGKNIIKNLDHIFDPDTNKFKMGINNLQPDREIFIQGECILIDTRDSENDIKKMIGVI
jgi:hypothetical protein